jgi:hypothetical protein
VCFDVTDTTDRLREETYAVDLVKKTAKTGRAAKAQSTRSRRSRWPKYRPGEFGARIARMKAEADGLKDQ